MSKQNNFTEKLSNYLISNGLTQRGIAEKLNVSEQFISALVNGRRAFGRKTSQEWQKHFGLSASWLMTGEGEMLIKPASSSAASSSLDATVIPVMPVSAQGGSLNDFVVSVRESDCEKIISPVKDADFAINVTGDSMAPEYPNGSQLHVKRINENAFIEWGKDYVLDTCNGTVIKRIMPSGKEGFVRCISINPNPIYAPFDVSMADIYGMYRVMLCLSMK